VRTRERAPPRNATRLALTRQARRRRSPVNELARAARVAAQLRELKLDRLLVSSAVNVRYLTGYTGSNGIALIAADGRTGHLFFTDFRYATQSAEQVPAGYEREIAPAELLEAAAQALGPGGKQAGGKLDRIALGFDDSSLTVKQHARLRELLADGWELVPCGGVVERLREVKDEPEAARIRAATQLADEALTGVLEGGLVGRSERDVAIELELRMRRLGAQAPSFPSIVAAGEHGALPHAEPRDVQIPRDVLVTIDWGAYLDGYCSDCTRTYATGALGEDATCVYELVLEAQEAALAAVRAGISGPEVDGVARRIIDDAGHAEHFGHGVGHGVGLEIHEGPRLSRTAGDEPLRVGNVVTVEPGVYLPGRLGVRIEDLVLVGDDGSERLTRLPKALTLVD
jgi:Xaa-Pro aminopeptidase